MYDFVDFMVSSKSRKIFYLRCCILMFFPTFLLLFKITRLLPEKCVHGRRSLWKKARATC